MLSLPNVLGLYFIGESVRRQVIHEIVYFSGTSMRMGSSNIVARLCLKHSVSSNNGSQTMSEADYW